MRFPLHVAPLLPGVAHVRSFSLSLSLTLSVVHAGVNIFLFFFLAAGRRCPRAWDAHTRAGANFDRGEDSRNRRCIAWPPCARVSALAVVASLAACVRSARTKKNSGENIVKRGGGG